MTFYEFRKQAGMSRAKLADQLGMREMSVYNWEIGNKRPSISTVRKIANLFSLPVTDIMPLFGYTPFKGTLDGLRMDMGLSQGELAELIGVNQCTVAAWETGKMIPRMESMQCIADGLGVRLDTVFQAAKMTMYSHPRKRK
jgi:DNA-binding XRE family transcriptional regulator